MPESKDGADPQRPRVTGWFDEPDEASKPLLTALGRVVWAAAALEHSLLVELLRLFLERQVELPTDAVARLEGLPAGPLLKELRRMELPDDLDERIGDAITRRNSIFHHPMENALLVRAIGHGENLEAAVSAVERLALDCGELAVELFTVASQRIEALTGMTRDEMMQAIFALAPAAAGDERDRRRLEALQALGPIDFSLDGEQPDGSREAPGGSRKHDD
jgi:hypothetical protein